MKRVDILQRKDAALKELLSRKRHALREKLEKNGTYRELMSADTALQFALNHHRNTRGDRMDFAKMHYLLYLYRNIDQLGNMVVEKSVQCFPAGTRVVTPFGYRPIEEVEAGHLVLTHTGNYRPVNKTFQREVDEELIERRSDLSPRIRSTSEHPFFAYRYDRERYHYTREAKVFGKGAEWVAASELKNGDFVARAKIPLSTGEEDEASLIEHCDRPIKDQDGQWFMEKWGQRYTARQVKLDYGFGQLVGLYLAEGWINEGRGGRSKRLCFGFHRDEAYLEHIVRREIDRLYKGKDPVHTYLGDKDNCRRVFVSSYPLVEAFRHWFGEGASTKSIPPLWLRYAPPSFLRGILDGALLGDGSRGKGAQSNYRTVSEELANGIRFIAAMHGIYGVIREENPKGKQTVYSFVYSDSRNRKYTRVQDINDAHVAVRVRETKKVPFKGTVYNLEVAGDNSYVAEDYVVHNCGLSELFIIQSHVEAGSRGLTVMYILPKYELRNRFVNNRIYKLHRVIEKYDAMVQEAETKVHRTSLMHFGKGTLVYVGSNVQDEFIEIPVDSAYVDEKDKCNQANLLYVPDRLTASPYKYQREIGNPTVEGFGIDERFQDSSKGLWHIKDPNSGEWFHPEFFGNVVREVGYNRFEVIDPDYVPHKSQPRVIGPSGKPVDRLSFGEYVHEFPERDWKGFRISQVFSRYTDMDALVREWLRSVGNDLKMQIFFNSRLGLPYSSKGAKLTEGTLYECSRDYTVPVSKVQARQTFMGVDVGASLHVVIRERVGERGNRVFRLVRAEAVPSFQSLGQLISEYAPRVVVVDAMPEIHKIMELKSDFGQVFSSRFQNDALKLQVDRSSRILTMDRTALLDFVKQAYDSQVYVLPSNYREIERGEFVKHLLASTRVLNANEENPERSRYEWVHKSPDHFFLADAYCYQGTMLVPDSDAFEFFKDESHRVRSGIGVVDRDVAKDTAARERLSELMGKTSESTLREIQRASNDDAAAKPKPADSAVKDAIDLLFETSGYVDVDLLISVVSESALGKLDFNNKEARAALVQYGFRESRIRGQFIR